MTAKSQNCVTGVVEISLSLSQISKGIQDKTTTVPKDFFDGHQLIRVELIDYKGELILVL